MIKRRGPDLRQQALRLPERALEDLSALARELRATGSEVTVAQATRGLCLLALELALGQAGTTAAEAFRLAASDPTALCVGIAVDKFLWLFDVEPSTTRFPPNTHPGGRFYASDRSDRGLACQGLRVPQRVRDQLETLTEDLRAAGAEVTAAEATRGLCLVALYVIHRASDTEVANAFRVAARHPTAEGVRRALRGIRYLLNGAPSTMPPVVDDEAPTVPDEDSSPSSISPSSRAA